MSKIVSKNQELNFIPSAYDTTNSTFASYSSLDNGLNDIDGNNSNARFTVATTQYYAYYNFSVTGIPENAENISVSCQVKATAASSSKITTKDVQLCYGTTPRGSSVTLGTSGTTAATVSITNAGTWTLSELSNIKLRLTAVRSSGGSGGGSSNYYLYFWGARLIISYTIDDILYEIVSSNLSDDIDSISPEGLTEVEKNSNYELSIYGDSIDNIEVLDNEIDVTSQLIQHVVQNLLEKYPESQTNSGIQSGTSYASYAIGKSAEDPYSSTSNMYASQNSTGYVDYTFDFSNIPADATIDSIEVRVYGHRESSTTDSTHVAKIGLYSSDTLKSTEQEFTSTSNQLITITNPGTWTKEELQNAKLRFTVGYYGGLILGVTWIVNYSQENTQYYWTYTLSNIQSDHTILIQNNIIEIPEEDPQYNYYPITISSINATTDPARGTTRVVEGTNQTITIYPSDPQITLVTDNGVDITSQLVTHGGTINQPTVSSVSGASYGFTLNSSTGYYVSQNTGQASSAAVCRVTFNLPVRCLVTIQYINYAEATYDYGIFGNIDVALETTYTADSNAYKVLSQSSDNSSSPQTLTYEINSGEHYIDIKYRKDTYTDSNNDTLQWKILSIEALEANNYYTYTLSNIQAAHSLIFIFGDVTYYFVNSSGTNCKLFPSGSLVQLPGDNYSLTIVPDNYNYTVTLKDNNVSVNPTRKEEEITKDGNTYTVVNYVYTLTDIQATHNLVVECAPNEIVYIKLNNIWESISNIYKKQDNRWVSVLISSLTDPSIVIYNGILESEEIEEDFTRLTTSTYSINGLSASTKYLFENVAGKPKITLDSSGEVSQFEFTDVSQSNPLHLTTGFNTLWYPYNETKDFEIITKFKFALEDQSDIHTNYPCYINTLDESNTTSYPGFKIQYGDSQNKTRSDLRLSTSGNYYWLTEPSDSVFYIKISHIGNSLKMYNLLDNNAEIFSYTGTFSTNVPLTIGRATDGSGNPFRYGVCDVYEFTITEL